MSIKCIFRIPARIISDMDSDDGVLEKEFNLDAIPQVDTEISDMHIKKALCRNEDVPIVVVSAALCLDSNSYIITTNQVAIDSNYLDRINGWGDKYLSQWI